ncbi:MAG: pyridoxal phosphate-dependent aminotransferase [Firmicutes bacterium]|nr:pyridoxal phosphate-dependent aminotransferase [Bacillota bacterium]
MLLSKRVSAMQFSPIRKLNKFGFKAIEDGKKLYWLNIGQPDLETPECFMEAIRNYNNKVLEYEQSGGYTGLLDAIIGYFNHYGVEFIRDQIIPVNGASEGLNMIFTSILNPGEKVMMAEPFYTNYATFCASAGGQIVPIQTKAEDGYFWADRARLEAAYREDIKAICCINPGNPTGNVLSIDDMRTVGEFAKEHDLWIIADEVYREFTFDGKTPVTFGQLPEYADRVIIVESVSKRYSACGARVGAVLSKNPEIMEAMLKLAQARLCSPTLEQVGAAELYKMDAAYYEEVKCIYDARRDAAYEEISKIPGVVCQKPGGSFDLMAKLPVDDAEKFLMFMLTEFEDNGETVNFSPAEGFYSTPGAGRDEIRIAYVLSPEKMRRAAELIRLGLEAYKARA